MFLSYEHVSFHLHFYKYMYIIFNSPELNHKNNQKVVIFGYRRILY